MTLETIWSIDAYLIGDSNPMELETSIELKYSLVPFCFVDKVCHAFMKKKVMSLKNYETYFTENWRKYNFFI
jgi:hypothetical protein